MLKSFRFLSVHLSLFYLTLFHLRCVECIFDVNEIYGVIYGIDILDLPRPIDRTDGSSDGIPESVRPTTEDLIQGEFEEGRIGNVIVKSKYGQRFQCSYDADPLADLNNPVAIALDDGNRGVTNALQSLLKSPCIVHTFQWWTYEFCDGKYITQFHLSNGVPEGEINTLGIYASDFNWNTEDVSSSAEFQERYHSQVYVNGSMCEDMGSPRSALVKFRCRWDTVFDHIAKVEEPAPCYYVVDIVTPKLCQVPHLQQFRFHDTIRKMASMINCQPLLRKVNIAGNAEGETDKSHADILMTNSYPVQVLQPAKGPDRTIFERAEHVHPNPFEYLIVPSDAFHIIPQGSTGTYPVQDENLSKENAGTNIAQTDVTDTDSILSDPNSIKNDASSSSNPEVAIQVDAISPLVNPDNSMHSSDPENSIQAESIKSDKWQIQLQNEDSTGITGKDTTGTIIGHELEKESSSLVDHGDDLTGEGQKNETPPFHDPEGKGQHKENPPSRDIEGEGQQNETPPSSNLEDEVQPKPVAPSGDLDGEGQQKPVPPSYTHAYFEQQRVADLGEEIHTFKIIENFEGTETNRDKEEVRETVTFAGPGNKIYRITHSHMKATVVVYDRHPLQQEYESVGPTPQEEAAKDMTVSPSRKMQLNIHNTAYYSATGEHIGTTQDQFRKEGQRWYTPNDEEIAEHARQRTMKLRYKQRAWVVQEKEDDENDDDGGRK